LGKGSAETLQGGRAHHRIADPVGSADEYPLDLISLLPHKEGKILDDSRSNFNRRGRVLNQEDAEGAGPA
jgi:hypothetical protein